MKHVPAAFYCLMNSSRFALTTMCVVTIFFSALPGSFLQQSISDTIQEGNTSLSRNLGDSVYPAIAASGRNVYVVWQDDQFGQSVSYDERNYDIIFARSTNEGHDFENVTKLTDNIEFSGRPIIAASDKNVYVLWMEDTITEKQLWFRKSNDSGSTFDEAIVLGRSTYVKDSVIPKGIAAFGNDVYIVWRQLNDDGKTASIMFKASTDGGNTFDDTKELSKNAVYSSSPKIAAYNQNVYIVWDVIRDANEKTRNTEGIFFVTSADKGTSFRKEANLNGNKEFGEAQVAAYSNEVYVAWAGSIYNPKQNIGDVFLRSSLNNGNTFADAILVNKDFVDSENVELSATERRIDTVWQDRISGNGEIFFERSSYNNKTSFIESPRNLSNSEGLSECPSIAISGNTSYVVWEDSTYGNREIFFKRVTST